MTAQDSYLAFMMDYAAGNQTPAFSLAGDLHVSLNESAADMSFLWSVIGGVLLESAEPAKPDLTTTRPATHAGQTLGSEDVMVMANANVKWRRNLWGAQFSPIGLKGARLMRLLPGKATPRHGHHGLEATVVLHGCLSDGEAIYSRGDLALGEPGIVHKPHAVGEEACICYVAEETRWKWWPH